jgi:trk system potassium uptake protein TrkH
MYVGMTALEAAILRLGGMSGYDALCHALTTMSTGGFSTSTASMAGWPTPLVQWTVIAFMLLAGINFDVHQQLISRRFSAAWRNVELRVFLGIVVVVTLLCFVVLRRGPTELGVEEALRQSAFQVVSIGTTTGFGSADFDRWPDILRLTLLLSMFVGGCAGSTAGGMKVVRIVIFFKSAIAELQRTVHPRAVLLVRIGDRPLARETVSNVMSFLAIWLALYAFVTYVLTLLGMDLMSATSATAANLGNIGPGLASVGPTANYASVPTVGKWVLIGSMLLGRLELYSVLVLLLRTTWIR